MLIAFDLMLACGFFYPSATVAQQCSDLSNCTGTLTSGGGTTSASGTTPSNVIPAVGLGQSTNNLTNGTSINVTGATISGFNQATISIGNGNTLNINGSTVTDTTGSTVTVTSTTGGSGVGSLYNNGGPNTIEAGANNTINIENNSTIANLGGVDNNGNRVGNRSGEGINVFGFGNLIVNRGVIVNNNSSAIFLNNSVNVITGSNTIVTTNNPVVPMGGDRSFGLDGTPTTGGTFANVIENFGTIEALPAPLAVNNTAQQAIGQTLVAANARNTLFINETNGLVIGDVNMGPANDAVVLLPESDIEGANPPVLVNGVPRAALDGEGGDDTLTLNSGDGQVGSIEGQINGFEHLTKINPGEWVITGAINHSGSEAGFLTAEVQGGTLTLTDNTTVAGFGTGSTLTVDPGAVLQIGRAGTIVEANGTDTHSFDGTTGSFQPPIADNGTVAFNRSNAASQSPTDGSPPVSGAISGSGQVGQIGTGTLTLASINTYSGGAFINSGILDVGSDNTSGTSPLGAANGPLTFNAPQPINTTSNPTASPPTFQFGASFQLNPGRPITIDTAPGSPGGTFDTQDFEGVITQGITGPGSLTKIGSGTLILNGGNTYSGGTNVNQGLLVVGTPPPFGTVPTDNPTATLAGGGLVTVAPGATLGGFGSETGPVINNGTIAAGSATPGFGSAAVAEFIINGTLQNNALVNLSSDPSFIGNVLRVNGDYHAGPDAVLNVNTFLNAGGPFSAQETDRLLITGNVTGSTAVEVFNPEVLPGIRGPGGVTDIDPDDGILVIQVGGSVAPDAFFLPGGYANGDTPFQYHLNAFGPRSPPPADPAQTIIGDPDSHTDFRLQVGCVEPGGRCPPDDDPFLDNGLTGPDGVPPPGQLFPNPRPGFPEGLPPGARLEVVPQAPAYISTPRALFQAGFLDLSTLHQRLGEIRDDQTMDRQGQGEFFIRAYGSLYNYTTNRNFVSYGYNFSDDYAAVQFGGSYNAIENEDGTLRVGVAGAIGRMWMQPSAVDGMSKALFNTQNFFGTVTWQDRLGWYVDGVVMGGLFDGRFTTPNRGQTTGMNGTTVGASIEAGWPFPLPWDLSFEPQAQLDWQRLNFENRTDVDFIDVDLGNPDQVTARVGFRLKRPFQTDDGMRFTPYFKANVLQGIGGSSDIVLSGFHFGTGNLGTALQVGAGVTGTLTRNLSVYGDFSWQSQVGNGGGFRGWAFNGGLRWLFGQAPAPAPAYVPVSAAPAPLAARSYLVFFDWDKATLTARARQIIREAAESSTHVQYTRIEVNGHTDTTGTPSYNQGLSIRRAQAVAGELVRDGVPAGAITIRGYGQTNLLVPTGPGVREPQNRRVEIVIR